MLGYFFWDPNPVAFRLPIIDHPVAWYGILFALGFFIGYHVLLSIAKGIFPAAKREAKHFTEKLSMYMAISTVLGARLGHILFYESPLHYLMHPWLIFKTWEGGLASHGAVVGIIIGIILFHYRTYKTSKRVSILRLLDLILIPGLFPSIFIRIGNFVNQEILGTKTLVPWAIIFGHPRDESLSAPRHPVQLYEAAFYLIACVVFAPLFKRLSQIPGRLTGLFFLSIFGFRFLVEFLKEEQCVWMTYQGLNMGQILSIPLILFGMTLLALSLRTRNVMRRNEGERSF